MFGTINWSGLRPINVTGPFGGLGSDPFSTPVNHDGYMLYAGARYNFPNKRTKMGFEFNHGSKYWFNFAQAQDDIIAPKTSIRGNVYETYLTHRINPHFIVKADYIHYDAQWSGSGWNVGAPQNLVVLPRFSGSRPLTSQQGRAQHDCAVLIVPPEWGRHCPVPRFNQARRATMNSKISRREFLKASTAGAAIAGVGTATAQAVSHPPGRRGNERVELIATNCEMCFWRCGVLAEVKDGKVLKLQGNPNHPLTKGKLCARGNAGTQLLYDPDRLKYPQVRTGSRGAGQFSASPGMRPSISLPVD